MQYPKTDSNPAKKTPSTVTNADARSMIRLAADVVGLNADHATAKRYLMDGLARFVSADYWIWTLAHLDPETFPTYVGLLHGGFTEEGFVRLLEANNHPAMLERMRPFSSELAEKKTHVTRLRQELDPENRMLSSDAHPLWVAAGIGPLILSARPLASHSVSLIALYRSLERPPFDERERKIAHILLSEVPWLHQMGWPEDLGVQVPTLSKRCRLVLNLLLEGHSRQRIADQMEISVHTVGNYVKQIYRTFSVTSQTELIRRFLGSEQIA